MPDGTFDPTRARSATVVAEAPTLQLRDFAIVLKPRVMSLVVFTALVGMVVAPGSPDLLTALAAIFNVAVGAGAAGALNMWYDRDIDQVMTRTRNRPIPAGRMSANLVLAYGLTLAVGSVIGMATLVNELAAGLLALTILYYVAFYTMWLKRRTPQNIVIGGAVGAFPPMIGWAAASGEIGLGAIAMFLIIFLWTPPHSWALALAGCRDYARAGIPMMPVVVGDRSTKRQILVYTALMVPATLLPVLVGVSGMVYAVAALALGIEFVRRVVIVSKDAENRTAMSLFKYSIAYLFLIFVFLLVDRAIPSIF